MNKTRGLRIATRTVVYFFVATTCLAVIIGGAIGVASLLENLFGAWVGLAIPLLILGGICACGAWAEECEREEKASSDPHRS